METVNFTALGAPVKGYLHDDYDTLKAHKTRPAVVICAGGAYRWLSPREKDAPALEFLSEGYNVFLIEYSCREGAAHFRPLRELADCVKILRENCAEYRIDPEKIAVLGFSAGGHLAASLGALWDDEELGLSPQSRPDALVLCYPVISLYDFAHEESADWVTGGDEAMRKKLHIPDRVGSGFPPSFIWHGGEDTSVPPENSLMLAGALRKAGVPFEYHLFSGGRHGISTCTVEVETPDAECRAWVPLCKTWLSKLFAFEK